MGFEPDYQVIVEWEAVGKIVDAMGGVYFDVPRDMNYEDPAQDLSIHQTKGYRLLSGDDAMQVLRYRHDNRKNGKMLGYPDGDLGRIKTQQGLLKAMIEQLMSLKNITKVNEFIKVFNENVETDLSFQNMLWFAKQAFLGNSSGAKLDTAQVNFVTMPNKNVSCWSRVYHSYQSYVTPNAQELLELVNNELSPFVEPSTMSDLDIMSVNSDGSVSSTTGHVEDSKAAAAPVISSGERRMNPPRTTIRTANGNLIDPDTGEVIAPSETETGTDMPATEPTTPQEPETGGSGASTGGEPPAPPAEKTAPAAGETPEEPDDSGIIVVPTEPTELRGFRHADYRSRYRRAAAAGSLRHEKGILNDDDTEGTGHSGRQRRWTRRRARRFPPLRSRISPPWQIILSLPPAAPTPRSTPCAALWRSCWRSRQGRSPSAGRATGTAHGCCWTTAASASMCSARRPARSTIWSACGPTASLWISAAC